MGMLRFVREEGVDCFRDAGAAPAMASFIWTPPGTAAANRPPPVAARNCLRSTDLLTRELRMPNPPKWPSRSGQTTTRGIIRLLRGRGSHKIVLVDTNEGKMRFEKGEQILRGSSQSQTMRNGG